MTRRVILSVANREATLKASRRSRLLLTAAAKDLLLLAALANVASGQSLERRVTDVKGSIVFSYATKPNVCGDGSSINISDDNSPGSAIRYGRSGVNIGIRRGGEYERCEIGPATAVLYRDGDRVTDVRITIGGRPEREAKDLGEVPPDEAAAYLLAIAPTLAGRAADHAVMGAYVAHGAVVWRKLLEIARDNQASESARQASVFWVSQDVRVATTAGLQSRAEDDEDLSVRKDALFFLAQRPRGEGIPALVKVAETSKSVALKRDAIFFLAQSRDDRALALFEKLLAGK
jgi:hypothetical protein